MFTLQTGLILNLKAVTTSLLSEPAQQVWCLPRGGAILGARVALIERHLMGGDCLNYGCVPSKALIRAAHAAYAVMEAREFGIEAQVPKIQFTEVMKRLRRVRADISPHDSAERFRGLGVDIYLEEARFINSNTVEVAGERLEFKKAIIATGARAASPPIPGLTETGFLTNETVFALTDLPRRLIVIGAGPIGCELAQSFSRLGSKVSIITDSDALLPREDRKQPRFLPGSLSGRISPWFWERKFNAWSWRRREKLFCLIVNMAWKESAEMRFWSRFVALPILKDWAWRPQGAVRH